LPYRQRRSLSNPCNLHSPISSAYSLRAFDIVEPFSCPNDITSQRVEHLSCGWRPSNASKTQCLDAADCATSWRTISILFVLGSVMLLAASWSLPEDESRPSVEQETLA
jgi:hypothetical protein